MTDSQRILFVSSSYPENAEDWRGRFIADMITALAGRRDITMSVWAPPGELPAQVMDATSPDDRRWLSKLTAQGGIAHQLRRGRYSAITAAIGMLARLHLAYRRTPSDIVHANWLQNALPLWKSTTPALITVLGSDYGLLDKPGMRTALKAVFRERPTILAPNADWMVPKLHAAFGDVAKIEAVPFGVDRSWFAIDRQQAKPRCWLAVTRLTRNKLGYLIEWGQGLFGKDRSLHLFGPMQEEIMLPSWIIWHGPTDPATLRRTWFPRATGLITLSRHDEGRPQIMLEAMAAGLPVVASDIPAHRNLIHHRQTGYLVQQHAELGPTLETLEDMPNNFRIGAAARHQIKQSIGDWDVCAARYATLYRELRTS